MLADNNAEYLYVFTGCSHLMTIYSQLAFSGCVLDKVMQVLERPTSSRFLPGFSSELSSEEYIDVSNLTRLQISHSLLEFPEEIVSCSLAMALIFAAP